MRLRQHCAVAALLGLAACEEKIHRLLESPPPPNVRLSVTVQPSSLTLPRGGQLDVTATVVRVGDGGGAVSVAVEGLPAGITATVVTTPGPAGATATINMRATLGAAVGSYSLTVRSRAADVTDATSLLVLSVIDPPDVAISLSQPSITIARGGIARVGITLARTNFASPIALSVFGQTGISAQIPGIPIAGDNAEATIAVDASVAPGTYSVSVRATADGIERTAPLAVNVTGDPLQLLVGGGVTSPQLSTISQQLIVNRAAFTGTVTLSAEDLPVGITATFQPLVAGSPTTSVIFTIAGTIPPGTYPVTVRASGNGVPDATVAFSIAVSAASIALAVSPTTAIVSAGGASTTELSLTRRDFSGAVAFDGINLPAGISIVFDSSSIRGNRTAATIAVGSAVTPGSYAISIRATPLQLAASAAQTASLALTVTPPTAGAAVVLDWSGCASPAWVALQDGTGPWTRLTSSGTTYLASVASAVGGIAYVAENNLFVRYMTKAEFGAGPVKLCATVGLRVVRGRGVHAFTGTDVASYSLGGGSGTSSLAQPEFSIAGVRDGLHDLVATLAFGGAAPSRFLIRRDVEVSATSDTLGTVNISGPDGIVPIALLPPVTVTGPVTAGEVFGSASSLMTTAACIVNPLRTQAPFTFTTTGGASFSLTLVGVPASSLRPTDFYLASTVLSGSNSSRMSTIAFHEPATRTLALAPPLAVPTVTELPGTYKRLQVAVGAVSQTYNQSISLQYGDMRGSIAVSATRDYFDASAGTLATPDLSAVSGWPANLALSSTGTWRLVADGATSAGPACVENRMTFTGTRSGIY